jgi:hypothetical protein
MEEFGRLAQPRQVERIRKWLPDPAQEAHQLLQASEENYHEEERKEASRQQLKKMSLYGAAAFAVIVMILGTFSYFKMKETVAAQEKTAQELIRYTWIGLGDKKDETDRLKPWQASSA